MVLAAFVIASCRPAAAIDTADRCFVDKMRAVRVVAAREFRCGDDEQCLDKAAVHADHIVDAANARATAAGFACPATTDSLGLAGAASWPVRFVQDETGSGADRCNSRQIRAATSFASAYSRCVARRVPDASGFDECAGRARESFAEGWNAALAADSCPGAGESDAAARIEDEIEESAARLEVHCGDGHVAGTEECDDGNTDPNDGCSADCRTESCGRVEGEVRCIVCPPDSVPNEAHDGCRCDDGFAGEPGACADIDECAAAESPCPVESPCVNLQGTYACSIACTADALHAALASCGAPSGAIAFNCTDTVIPIPGGMAGALLRESQCSGLVIDGAGRNITFELDPVCWQTPLLPEQCPGGLEEDGTCWCPNVDSGEEFLLLRGNDNVVRDLTVRGFFEGIPVRGRGNVVENVRFDRLCDDAFGSVMTGVGNEFRHLTVSRGCDKCSENGGNLEDTDPDSRVAAHYNAILSDIDFDGCRTPVRAASSGRFRLENLRMHPAEEPDFPCDGPRFSAGSDTSSVVVEMTRSTIEDCRHGVRLGRGTDAVISGSRISGCGLRGIRAAGTARVSVERSRIEDNGGSGSSEPGFGGAAAVGSAGLDLGGGSLVIDGAPRTSAGGNWLCDNRAPNGTMRDVDIDAGLSATATGNWWCSLDSPADHIVGDASIDPVLPRAPLEP